MSEQTGKLPNNIDTLHQDVQTGRRPYREPELQDFGSVGSLTQNNFTYSGSDGALYS